MEQFLGLLLWSILLALITAVIYRIFTKPENMRMIKKQINDLKQSSSKAQKAGDTKEANRLMAEMLKANNNVFRMNMKPMMVSFLVFLLPLYVWLPNMYASLSVSMPFSLPVVGDSSGWLFWYIVVILTGNLIFRKLLGVE
jgi:uncharacterized membrane protein (DUF106 family)